MKWYHLLPVFLATCVFAIFLNHTPETIKTESKIGLPTINITLDNVELSEIIENPKNIIYPNNKLTLNTNTRLIHYGNVEIKGHGNSTWGLQKSPFQIKFKNKVDLLGMGKAKKWVLLANSFDSSNLRNDIGLYLERMLNEEYALNGHFVELYINNQYQGLYYLIEKIEVGKYRVNLKDNLGIIVELENLHSYAEQCYRTTSNTCLIIHDLVNENNKEVAMLSFTNNFDILEQAAKSGNYDTVKQLIDISSFAKYFLLSEFTVNPDAYVSSFFFYKDGLDDKIHAGPGWDFDYALGNRTWVWSRTEDFYSPEVTRILERYSFGSNAYNEVDSEYANLTPDPTISRLMFYLYRIPEFKTEVEKIYREQMMGKKDELLNYIRSKVELIHDAAIRNEELWQETNLNPLENLNSEIITGNNTPQTNLITESSFESEINYLLDWINRRFDYFDYEYSGLKEYYNTFN